jgi:hypothetical protein
MRSGSENNDRSSAAPVKARRPLKVAASRGPSRSVASKIQQHEILVRLLHSLIGSNLQTAQ